MTTTRSAEPVPEQPDAEGLYIVLISVHGLIRGRELELGRDADTGGQVKYVVELSRALAAHPDVEAVDLLTRQVIDPKVDPSYAEPFEEIAPGARLVRLQCGPRRYLRKEVLWPYLDSFVDQALRHLRSTGKVPDFIHSHYADAGHVGANLAGLLGVPLAHTGHSLGRVKRQRLLEQGMKEAAIESQYNMQQRIEAEETVLGNAAFVVASTHQEVEEQYGLYDDYDPRRMIVIPPGMELEPFHPPQRGWKRPPIETDLERFLRPPRKPLILALARPDPRKNLATLMRVYGKSRRLQELAHLVIVAGNRDDLRALEKGPREVLGDILYLVDLHDLYGSVAYPKHHRPADVPDLYRLAARRRGVFVNPALTEPFGLTLVEAAACGVPVVSTNDGGPRDIIARCKNGLLVDPLDEEELEKALLDVLGDRARWKRWSRRGIRGAQAYSWKHHVRKYLQAVKKTCRRQKRRRTMPRKNRLSTADRVLICDIDNTLIGDREALEKLLEVLREAQDLVAFAVATGRNLESALKALKEWGVPIPDVLFTSVGSEIHYGARLVPDDGWKRHIDYRWQPDETREALRELPGLELQPRDAQRPHKISYDVDPAKAPRLREIARLLRQRKLHARLIYSHDAYLDVLPVRASKGHALRHFAVRWGVPVERLLVAGDSGNDEDMLSGDTLGVVVGNHSPELETLRGKPRIYFAEAEKAWGVLEGIEHYDFLGAVRIPDFVEATA